ncbi:ABC transporter ATP-binding protein [Halorubrum trueperi]|uniref:ABC transporter ATP-binding protein n=1 Tax=Halorubrum trueperi TaxID=2004704 RepID=A0ABD5UQB7_9EURY
MSETLITSESDRATNAVLQMDGIDTYYQNGQVLFDVSLSVRPGEIVALVGRNGAGKTTTLRSIMGLTPPRSGQVLHRGEDITGQGPDTIRRNGISWVPEERRIFPDLTVEENLRIAQSSGDDTDTSFVYDRFPRLDERRGQLAGTMSGGEQQMLAIARGLLGPSLDVLLLDEPSEGLAPSIVKDVAETIRTLKDDGVTMILVEQNAEMALELADYAYVIQTGEIVYQSDADQFRSNQSLMQQYLGV